MTVLPIETRCLTLVLQTREEVRAEIERMPADHRAEVSPAWLALLDQSSAVDPWIHGFRLILRRDGSQVGTAGFKGPPDAAGMVEIAYGVAPEYQGNGYATEAAEALAGYAFSTGEVRIVRAHTQPVRSASASVLRKCGFAFIGAVVDPEDGQVWRWEKAMPPQ